MMVSSIPLTLKYTFIKTSKMNISVCTMKLKKQHLQGWRIDSMIKSACLQRSGVWIPVSKYNNLQQPVTPAPRDLTPPSDYQGNCTYVYKLHIQTHTHIIRHKRCLRNRNRKLFILLKLCQHPPGYLCLLLLYCFHHHFVIHAHPSPQKKCLLKVQVWFLHWNYGESVEVLESGALREVLRSLCRAHHGFCGIFFLSLFPNP